MFPTAAGSRGTNRCRDLHNGHKRTQTSDTEISIYGHKMDTDKQMVNTGPTEISIYGHKMDVDRQISPYMGINGHTQTDGQNGSYDNRYNGVCIKGWGIHSLFTSFPSRPAPD